MKTKITSIILTILVFQAIFLCSCNKTENTYKPISGLDTSEQAKIVIAIPNETDVAMNYIANNFMRKYPNVHITLQYVENYDTNTKKMMDNNLVDIIFKSGMNYSNDACNLYYNFLEDTEIDFSATTNLVMDNYVTTDGENNKYLYCVPLGGEVRGLFVNTSFLKKMNVDIPTNYEEFLACCEKIYNSGYIPIQGNAGTAPLGLGIPLAANTAVHDSDIYDKLAKNEPGIADCFRDAAQKVLTLAEKHYFDYKTLEESTGVFKSANDKSQAQNFLGISINSTTFETTLPENSIGTVAFFPYISSIGTTIQYYIDKYNLSTEFTFIPTPLNDRGTKSPVYFTPSKGIVVNKNSASLKWVREFVNYLYTRENLISYGQMSNIIPNTTDAFNFLSEKYHLNAKTDCVLCGQILFDSYNAFNPLKIGFTNVAKACAKKYMVVLNYDENHNVKYYHDDEGDFLYIDNDGKPIRIDKEYVGEEDPLRPGYAFCNLDYYIMKLEKSFAENRG